MANVKVCPIIVLELPEIQSLQLTDRWEDDYGSGNRHDQQYFDYLRARRAFLNSYHFSKEEKFKTKLKRSVKELNEATMGIASDVRQEISRIRFRVLRIKLGLPSLLINRIGCFNPGLNKYKIDHRLTMHDSFESGLDHDIYHVQNKHIMYPQN